MKTSRRSLFTWLLGLVGLWRWREPEVILNFPFFGDVQVNRLFGKIATEITMNGEVLYVHTTEGITYVFGRDQSGVWR
jgi:hypothetical protein